MTTPEVRRPLRGYVRNNRRRKLLDVDLNVPPGEALEERAGNAANPQLLLPQPQRGEQESGGSCSFPVLQEPAMIDVEAIDDEVVISSPRRFAEAKKKARRNNNVVVLEAPRVHPGNSEEEITRLSLNSYNMRRRVPPNQTIIDCEQYINIESTVTAKEQTAKKSQEPVQIIPPPKEPVFTCPICTNTLVEEMTTKCGHIFCKKCIKDSISFQNKCPICRRKLTMKDIIRVYLPTTS